MYAIIQTGGKQYKVQEGDKLKVEKLVGSEEGQLVTFNRVLYVSAGEEVKIGTPLLEAASVEAEVIRNDRSKKVLVFKKKRRKGYSKKQGHRQDYSEIKVLKIVS